MATSPARRGVDIGALAAHIQAEAARRVADSLTVAMRALSDDGHDLADRHVAELIRASLQCFDGFEISTIRSIRQELGNIEQWGLSREHAFLVSEVNDA